MTAIGGSIESVAIDGREFPVAGDADVGRKLGGYENDLMFNGNGTARLIKTPVGWSLDGLVVQCDDSRQDQEFLQNIADSSAFVVVAVTYASGITYQGTGQILGEFNSNNQSATQAVTMGGTGKLTQQ